MRLHICSRIQAQVLPPHVLSMSYIIIYAQVTKTQRPKLISIRIKLAGTYCGILIFNRSYLFHNIKGCSVVHLCFVPCNN